MLVFSLRILVPLGICTFASVAAFAKQTTSPVAIIESELNASSYYNQRLDTGRIAMGLDANESYVSLKFKQDFSPGTVQTTVELIELDDTFSLSQLNASLSAWDTSITIGRTELRNVVIPVQTMRRSDLIEYTHVLNGEQQVLAYSEKAQLYAPSIAFDYSLSKGHTVGVWSSERLGHGDYNTVGTGYMFANSNASLIKQFGLILDAHNVAHNSEWIYALIAGVEFQSHASVRGYIQGIYVRGTDKQSPLDSYANLAAVNSYSVVGGLSYSVFKPGAVGFVSRITAAYKQFPGLPQATQVNILPAMEVSLFKNISLLAQFNYSYQQSALRDYQHRIEIDIGIKAKLGRRI